MTLLLPQPKQLSHGTIARNASQSAYPSLWRGLTNAWVPALGQTGLKLVDAALTHRPGELTNMPASAWVATQKGLALTYAGTDDFVTTYQGLKLRTTGAMTVVCLVKGQSGGASIGSVCGNTGNSGFRGFMVGPNNVGTWGFYIAENDITFNSQTVTGHDSTVWTNYAHVYEPSTRLTIYRNGVQVAENTTSIPASQYINNGYFTKIGNRGDGHLGGGTAYFSGEISTVLYYHRVLVLEEIQTLYRDHLAPFRRRDLVIPYATPAAGSGRSMGSLAGAGGLAGPSGLAGTGGGIAG